MSQQAQTCDHAGTCRNARSDVPLVPDGVAEPAVPTNALQIVGVAFIAGIFGVLLGIVAGFGPWGLILAYIALGHVGMALLILARMAA